MSPREMSMPQTERVFHVLVTFTTLKDKEDELSDETGRQMRQRERT